MTEPAFLVQKMCIISSVQHEAEIELSPTRTHFEVVKNLFLTRTT